MIIIVIFILVLLICLICFISYKNSLSCKKNKPIPENKDIIKYKIKKLPSYKDQKITTSELIFEPADINYYKYKYKNDYNLDMIYDKIYEDDENDKNDEKIVVENITNNPVNNPINNPVNIITQINEINQNNEMVNLLLEPGVDTQNVHDTSVNKYIRNIYRDIVILNNNDDNIIQEIKDYANSKNYSIDQINKINTVLEQVKIRNSTITNLNNKKELDILNAIWIEANNKEDQLKTNIKDMLMIQIIDSIESSHVLCPTGFVNRISIALIVENPENFPKTSTMINNEMMQTMSNIRTNLESDAKYIHLTDEKKTIELKNKFFEKIEVDYKGILTREEIDNIIKPWIEYV